MTSPRKLDAATFSLGAYLLDLVPAILICVCGVLAMAGLLWVMGLSVAAIAMVCVIPLLSFAVGMVWDFGRKRRFWKEASRAAAEVEDVRTFADLVKRPSFLEGRCAFDTAASLGERGADQVSRILDQACAQRTYTELWAHEIKGPLAACRLATSALHGEAAETLNDQLERIEASVEQALFAARVDSVESDYVIRDVGLLALCQEACKKTMRSLVARGVALDFEIGPEVKVFADKAWLSFIISQVVLNAAQYDATLIRFSARDEMGDTSHGRTVLEIGDNGCGVPACDVPRVFDRGFTGEVGRAHGSATGMGLYLVALMCAKMGLGVAFASEEGHGSRVLVSFPHDRRLMNLTRL